MEQTPRHGLRGPAGKRETNAASTPGRTLTSTSRIGEIVSQAAPVSRAAPAASACRFARFGVKKTVIIEISSVVEVLQHRLGYEPMSELVVMTRPTERKQRQRIAVGLEGGHQIHNGNAQLPYYSKDLVALCLSQ